MFIEILSSFNIVDEVRNNFPPLPISDPKLMYTFFPRHSIQMNVFERLAKYQKGIENHIFVIMFSGTKRT